MVRAFNFHTLAIMRKKVYDIKECKYGGMVDAQVSDACDLIIVRVQISLFAPSKQRGCKEIILYSLFFCFSVIVFLVVPYFLSFPFVLNAKNTTHCVFC